MDPKTISHLRVAARNRDLARALLDPSHDGIEPAPWEWVAVIAFYSAVHYVNAYLWERYQHEPRNHDERTYGVRRDPSIRPCRMSYDLLKDTGYYARYVEVFTLTRADARELLDVHVRAVEATVLQALGKPVPAW